jgi:hypothetical protein
MAEAVSNRPLTDVACVHKEVHVGFVVDKVVVGEVFLRVLQTSLSISFYQCSMLMCQREMDNRHASGHSSETSYHTIHNKRLFMLH